MFQIFRLFSNNSFSRMNAGPAKPEQPDTGLLIEHLTQIEGLAESILADKQKLINLDRQRNKTREAIR